MKQYETVFILTPVLSEDQVKETVNKFRKFLTEKGAEIIYEEDWGMRKLAYAIQKKSSGFYHLFEYKAPAELINDFEIQFRRDERVLRFLTIVLDKHSLAYNEKKRDLKKTDKKVIVKES
jgi:small subunit ribosomal protein S6